MKHTVLITAPYMIPVVDRFKPVFDKYGIEPIIPDVQERMEEADLLKYAGEFDGAICGDDRYSARVIDACAPRLKVISKWGTGIDSIDADACFRYQVKIGRTLNAFTQPVADTVLGYMLAFARRQPWMDKEMKAGKWEKMPGIFCHRPAFISLSIHGWRRAKANIYPNTVSATGWVKAFNVRPIFT